MGLPSLFCMRSTYQAIRCQPWEDELVPIWAALQMSGAHNIRERIMNGLRITNDIVQILKDMDQITSSVKGNQYMTPYNDIWHSLDRVAANDDAEFDSIKSFLSDTWKAITQPESPRLTLVFQWTPKIEVEPSDFTDNLLDACNYKMLITIQGMWRQHCCM